MHYHYANMLRQFLLTKMAQLKKNNRQFAEYLGISTADLCRVINGKRPPSDMVKSAIYTKWPHKKVADMLLLK